MPATDGVAVIDWAGEAIALHPGRGALLVRHATLLVADLHLGKARAFRQLGLPVPSGTTRETIAQLDALVRATAARRVVFLGDLLHSRHAQGSAALAEFAAWRAAHPALALTLVRGNHDRHAGDPPAALGIEFVEEPFALGGVALCHHPHPPGAKPGQIPPHRIAGHLHPCLGVQGGSDRLRLPCFHFTDEVAVLPAFGAFTGMHPVRRQPGDRVWVVADDRVVAVP